jgi:hypothetical protein
VEQESRRLVAHMPELRLQLQRRDAVRVRGDDVGRQEPGLQREVAAVHHRARRDRGLTSAVGTLPGGPAALQRSPVAAPARGTCEAIRPSPPRQVLRARVIVREPGLEGLSRGDGGLSSSGRASHHGSAILGCSQAAPTTIWCMTGVRGISLGSRLCRDWALIASNWHVSVLGTSFGSPT